MLVTKQTCDLIKISVNHYIFKCFTYYYSDVVYHCNRQPHILWVSIKLYLLDVSKSSITDAYPQNNFLITIQPKLRQIWFYVNLLRYDLCLMVLYHVSLLFMNTKKLI